MYMPILRGKRFELLALRDLAAENAVSKHIVPIIEPVKAGTTATELRRAIDGWLASGGSLGVVVNPSVGELRSSLPNTLILDQIYEAQGGDWRDADLTGSGDTPLHRLFPVLIVSTDAGEFAQGLEALRARFSDDVSVALWLRDNVPTDAVATAAVTAGVTVTHVLVSESRAGKRLARALNPAPGVVVFGDHFPSQATNAEYPDQREQVFTEEHMYFHDDNLAGFCDYGTIGADYRDGGGAPKYVVIHWTYQHGFESPSESPVYLQHFCSDHESVVAPVQTKYSDAANKLVAFCDREGLPETPGLTILRRYHAEEGFPGLGMLKKISIMNHLAVMDRALGDASL